MNSVDDKLPQFDRDVIVFNKHLDAFDIDKKVKAMEGDIGWCWLKSDKRSITHWAYTPPKPQTK